MSKGFYKLNKLFFKTFLPSDKYVHESLLFYEWLIEFHRVDTSEHFNPCIDFRIKQGYFKMNYSLKYNKISIKIGF